MKLFLLLLGMVLVGAISVDAQQKSRNVEVIGGYSLIRLDNDFEPRNLSGWQLSVNSGFPRKIGFEIAADFSGHYGKFDVHTGMVGPRFLIRGKSLTLYSHFMHGFAQIGGDLNRTRLMTDKRSETSFAESIGFGINLKVSERVAICPIRYDVVLSNWGKDQAQLHSRFSSALLFRFDKK